MKKNNFLFLILKVNKLPKSLQYIIFEFGLYLDYLDIKKVDFYIDKYPPYIHVRFIKDIYSPLMKITGEGTRIKLKKKELNNISTRFLNNKDNSLFFDENDLNHNDLINVLITNLFIQFMTKLEEKCKLELLDILIKKYPTIPIYFKPTFNEQNFNFNFGDLKYSDADLKFIKTNFDYSSNVYAIYKFNIII